MYQHHKITSKTLKNKKIQTLKSLENHFETTPKHSQTSKKSNRNQVKNKN